MNMVNLVDLFYLYSSYSTSYYYTYSTSSFIWHLLTIFKRLYVHMIILLLRYYFEIS